MAIVKNNVKKIRKHYGISDRAIAEKTGISKSQINRIENCLESPTLDKLYAIAKALNVKIKDLIVEPDEPQE